MAPVEHAIEQDGEPSLLAFTETFTAFYRLLLISNGHCLMMEQWQLRSMAKADRHNSTNDKDYSFSAVN